MWIANEKSIFWTQADGKVWMKERLIMLWRLKDTIKKTEGFITDRPLKSCRIIMYGLRYFIKILNIQFK